MCELPITIDMTVIDGSWKHTFGEVKIRLGEPHRNIKGAHWYYYEADVQSENDGNIVCEGRLVHSPRRGIIRLLSKVFKAIKKEVS